MSPVVFDEIGYWSEVKLEIVRDYAKEWGDGVTSEAWRKNPALAGDFCILSQGKSKVNGNLYPGK